MAFVSVKKPAMNLKHILMLFVMAVFAISCDDDDNVTPGPPNVVYSDYSSLKVGNYWVYQRFNIDNAGNETATTTFDSCYVEKDTVINGITYMKLVKPGFDPSVMDIFYLRDSLHYTVNHLGEKILSSIDFISILTSYYHTVNGGTDTVAYITRKMADLNMVITVPAGTYTTINSKLTYDMYPTFTSGGDPRYMHSRYAKDIGIVLESLPFYVSTPAYSERRLVRFSIN
jgi:hypothetical protein